MTTGKVWVRPGVALVFLALSVPALRGTDAQGSGISAPQQPPVRDRAPGPQVGTSAVRGRVIDSQTGVALARARVRLMGRGSTRPLALTDDQGVFTFTGVPAGAYAVSAEKATYTAGSYPERGTSLRMSMTRPLVVKEGEAIDGVIVRLFRGSAITGRVVDAHGDPVESAQVAAIAVHGSGSPRAGFRSMMSTNDIGEFRIGRLPPGRYLLMVNPTQRGFQEPANVDPAPLPQPVPTYFPGVLSRSEAQPIVVGRGQTVSGVEIVMFESTPAVVTGRVIAADGQPVSPANGGGFVNVRLDDVAVGGMTSGGASLRPDGSFQLLLAPGDYILEARRALPAGTSGQGRVNEQYGMTRVSVAGAPMDVSILVGGGATASGRVVFEGAAPPPAPPVRAGAPLSSADGGVCRSGQLEIAEDWSFKLDGLMGTCGAPPVAMFGRWTVKSAVFNDQDLLNSRLTFEPGQHYGNVRIVVTDRRSELNLHVIDERGQGTQEYVALVFSTDQSRWHSPVAPTIRTFVPRSPEMLEMMQQMTTVIGAGRGGLPPPSSREMIAGLTPGDYYAIALDDIDADAARDPAVLERLASSASRVTVSEGPTDLILIRRNQADLLR
jgi:hypothetical protein